MNKVAVVGYICAGSQYQWQRFWGRAERQARKPPSRGASVSLHAAAALPRPLLLHCQQLQGAEEQEWHRQSGVLAGAGHS